MSSGLNQNLIRNQVALNENKIYLKLRIYLLEFVLVSCEIIGQQIGADFDNFMPEVMGEREIELHFDK